MKHNNCKVDVLTSNDLESVVSLQPDGWPDILPSIRYYWSSEFCFPLKASINGTVVGMGTAIIYGNTAWLAHIIVHKEHRNAGIGTTLTHALIELIHKTPCRTILLIATALGEPVYTKAGFEIDTQYTFLDDGTLPPPSGRANEIKMFDKRYESDLLKLDYRVSGEHREKLFRSHWDAIKICVENGTLKGFYIPTLGEGLIIAEDPGTGFELMKLKYSTSKMFCIPVNNERGINFLTTNGYKEYRKATRMILGKKISWNSGKIYSRIGGNLG